MVISSDPVVLGPRESTKMVFARAAGTARPANSTRDTIAHKDGGIFRTPILRVSAETRRSLVIISTVCQSAAVKLNGLTKPVKRFNLEFIDPTLNTSLECSLGCYPDDMAF
jgi:hypothetical protein